MYFIRFSKCSVSPQSEGSKDELQYLSGGVAHKTKQRVHDIYNQDAEDETHQ